MGVYPQNEESYKLFLLPAYVLFETARATLTYAALHSGVGVSSTLVTLGAELTKAVFTTIFMVRWMSKEYGSISIENFLATIHMIVNKDGEETRGISYIKSYVKYMVPSFLYLINNILYLVALKLTTPALLHVAILAKLPITAILHHYLITPQRNGRSWLSLVTLTVGLLITNIPPGFSQWLINRTSDEAEPVAFNLGLIVGPVLGVIVAVISGFTSIYMETVMKQKVPFWVSQFWLYLFGTIFAGVAFSLCGGFDHMDDEAETPSILRLNLSLQVFAVIATTAATGLCVANILRKQDNLVKLVGTSASIVTIIIAQCILFPDLRQKTFTVQTVIGTGIISISIWTYNFYKQHNPRQQGYVSVRLASFSESDTGDDNEDNPKAKEEAGGSTVKEETYRPTIKRLLYCVFGIACLALLTARYRNSLEINVLTDDVVNKDPIQSFSPLTSAHPTPSIEPISTATSTPNPTPKAPLASGNDIQRFFVPNQVDPADWGNTERDYRCIDNWVNNQAQPWNKNFIHWEHAFITSDCPVYPIPDGGMIFHQYWTGKWRPFNEVSIEAWLATQRLGDGHRLIYWYEGGGPTEEVRQRFTTGEYGKYVEFREFDAVKEAEGYCVQEMPEWNNRTYIEENGMMVQSLSDIIRVLLLAKYGGVWLDADTIPVRDYTPMLRTGPTAGGLHDNGWNNNVLVFGPPGTEVTNRILEATCSFSANHTLYKERNGPDAVMPWTWYWLWNEGLFKACSSKWHCGVARFPQWFNDGFDETGLNQVKMRPCEPDEDNYGPGSEIPATMRSLFSWHARFNHFDDACVDMWRPTLAGAFRRRLREMLESGLDMNGRDVFPGPGFFN